jgi:Protein of unknown function (DUF3293)
VTLISAATLDAYRQTDYRLLGGAALTLRVDLHSAGLAALHAQYAVAYSAFITACNPRGERHEAAVNEGRQLALAAQISARGLAMLAGEGAHPQGAWPAEPSYLVPGLDRSAATALGIQFEQNAIIWSGADAVPRLLLLR